MPKASRGAVGCLNTKREIACANSTSIKASVLDKTLQVTGERLARTGSEISGEIRTPHEAPDVARAIERLAGDSDMVLVFGASAMSDPEEDVIPAAIHASGGVVYRSGMPVDPGNLILLAELDGRPVLGLPGCARSPVRNGLDWVLERLAAENQGLLVVIKEAMQKQVKLWELMNVSSTEVAKLEELNRMLKWYTAEIFGPLSKKYRDELGLPPGAAIPDPPTKK